MPKDKKKSPVLKLTGDLSMYGLDDEIVQKYRNFHVGKDYLTYMWKNVIKEYSLSLDLLFMINGKKEIDKKLEIGNKEIQILGKQLTSAYIVTINSFNFNKRENQVEAVFGKHLSSLSIDFMDDHFYRWKYVVEKNRYTFEYFLYNPNIILSVIANDTYTKVIKYIQTDTAETKDTLYYNFTKNKLLNFEHNKVKIKFHSFTNCNKYKMAEYVDEVYNVAWFSKGNIKHLGQVNKEDIEIIDYVVYYKTGVIKTSHSFNRRTGLLQGKFTKYYANGLLEFTGIYHNSNKEGLWVYKDREGQITQRINWKDNLKQGTCYYYENGKLYMKKIFENNKCIKRIKM